MKTLTAASATATVRAPDFSGRPRRINLDKMVAVKGYGKLNIRPIRPDDESAMVRFHEHISEESIYMRYFEYLGLDRRTAHDRLKRICTNTAESYAIVAEQPAGLHHGPAILAVGRLTVAPEAYVASFDKLLIDEEQPTQLNHALLARLVHLAGAFGFKTLTTDLLVADHDNQNLCRKLGFTLQTLPKDGLVRVTLDL